MPESRAAKVVLKWERRLRAEGLAPIDQRICGRVVIRTEIITPKRVYLADPGRLRAALEAWLTGDRSHFNQDGKTLLAYDGNQFSPRRRARLLLRVVEGLCEGMTVNEASDRDASPRDVAYRYLRPLYATLAEVSPLVDDDHTGDDEPRGD